MTDPIVHPEPFAGSIRSELLSAAAEFMAHVREVQRLSGRRLVSCAHLPEVTLTQCFEAWDGSRLLADLSDPDRPVISAEVQGLLFERFEEMCRRRGVPIPDNLRPPAYRMLALEAAVNAHVFDADPVDVASATVQHGSLDHLPERFPEFAESPGVFRQAVRRAPSDPEAVLVRTREIEARLAADERSADFRDTSSLFLHAAVSNPDARTASSRPFSRVPVGSKPMSCSSSFGTPRTCPAAFLAKELARRQAAARLGIEPDDARRR